MSYEFDDLATFNAERSRGIVHTAEWTERMRLDKERFDAQLLDRAKRNGWIVVGTRSGTSVAPEPDDPNNTGSKPEVDQ